MGFWFFQSPVSLNANGSFSGQHSDGDVFVVSAFTNGGSAPNIDVYKWQAGALVKLTSGQTCTPGDTACAYVNSGPIPVSWFYLDKDGDLGSTVPASGFFEGGIDLNSLFSGGKIPCFSNFLAETRSSQAPNAQLKDLAIGAVDSCGTITIHKSATPKSAQSFGFSASGADSKVSGFSLVDNGDSAASTKKFESIDAGAYSISENQPPADWDFDHISCSTTGNGTTATPSGRSLAINLGAGGSADCTYYNVRKPSLTVTKSVVPASDTGSFGLQIDGQTKATGGNGTTTGAVLVGVGAHTVSELGANGTALGNYSAVYGGDCDASGHVTLAAGEAKACTITNTRIPTLTVQKVLLPAADTGTFGLQIDGQTKATGGDGTTTGAVALAAGAHSVGEIAAAGTDLSHYESSIGGDCAANGSVTLAPGDNKVCVITNRRKPTLTVTKVLVPANDPGTFGLQIDGQTKATGGNGTTTGKVELSSGAHSVAEVAAAGTNLDNYVSSIGGDCLADGSVSLAAGDNKTCTITNTRKARLLVIKKVVNDNGGAAAPSDFTLAVNATDPTPASFKGADTPGIEVTLAPGAYSVSETGGPAGYTGSFSAACTGTIALGETKTCTVTNDDQPAKLIVKKIVINDDGGTKTAADFSFKVNNGSATKFEADGQNDLTVNAGNYSVTEPAAAGYTTTYDNCDNLAVANGETKTCTITNNDAAAKLIVKKIVINDDGGTKTAADFSFKVNGGNPTPFEADGQNDLTVNAGNYSVTEPAADGYTTTYDNCNNVAIANGATATCTITNNDQPAKLIVKKIVINDNGGSAIASDFSFKVNGGNAVSFEADGQNDLTVDAGNYSVTEPAADGYTTTYDNCDNVALANGETKTCTITNNDQPSKLIVIKQVVNDNGGKAVSSDFTLAVDATNPTPASFKGADSPGVEVSLTPGAYSVSETGGPAGYTGSFSAACTGTIALGETKTCTVTNDDRPAKLIVKKVVINDNGGTKTAADFSFTVNGGNPTPFEADGQNDLTVDAGNYSVSEPAAAGYTTTYDNCDDLTVANGETKSCTITNNDQPAKLIVKKIVINDNGGTKTAADFSFKLNGGNPTAFEADGQNDLTVNAGNYSVTEPAAAGYTTTYDNCSELVLANGAAATCTITNDDQPAKLIVRKIVINDNGGTKTAADFSFTVNGGNPTPFEADGQNDLTVNAGGYSVTEPAAAGYTTSYDNCSELRLANGATATCTITNDDQPAKLIVKKIVINDNGGTKTAGGLHARRQRG